MDKIVTGMTVDDIKKTKISAHQEKLVKAVTAENIAKYDKVKNSLDKAYVPGDKILVKIILNDSLIALPEISGKYTAGAKDAKVYIFKIPNFIKNQEKYEELKVGDEVNVNLALIAQMSAPCLEWEEPGKICSIWAIQPERINYGFHEGDL